MIEHKPLAELGTLKAGWLTGRQHFPIGGYGNPAHRSVGHLYVWNDDEIAPHTGFPLHPHANVEIITYVREGAITHEDDLGNKGRTKAGDIQVMSAGRGIRHSEHNDEDVPTRIFQIWIEPNQRNGEPIWSAQPFPKADRAGRFVALASGYRTPDALPIRADAEVFGALLHTGDKTSMDVAPGHSAYLVPTVGSVIVNGVRVAAREGLALRNEPSLEIEALSDAELVLVISADST
ncbi:pirin family protein [Neorhizobium galegae]|uniref:Pirin family protein n=1 Tax=Neorhizobium galegae TaxID=399 RepID=A0A6A1TKL9_NEOGA|nr:pirin-like bicupin family protein [Neorhizobium galegae]KAB1085371.1 pirin family protein [Neorhizobium galegae]